MRRTCAVLRLFGTSICVTVVAVCSAQQAPTSYTSAPTNALHDSQLQSSAERGDAVAQFALAYRYDQAGTYDQALQWYGKAAQQGYALAQSALGSMYQTGRGVPQDFGEAVKWHRRAVKQDDPVAENNLGLMYARGQGTKPDLDQAMKLFEKSAEKGWAPGEANLAYLYAAASPRDLVRAYMWCTLALAGGQAGCRTTLEQLTGQMSAADIQKANDQTILWVQTQTTDPNLSPAAVLGPGADQLPLQLATMYAQGDGVARDDPQASKWYTLAAKRGIAFAQARLGEMYYMGRGVTKDDGQAFTWFQEAAENGDVSGERDLGFAYLHGDGVAKDEKKGVAWVRKAADRGDVGAQGLLAYCYQSGIGVQRNEQEAIRLYQKAVETGNAAALNNSAWIYATSQDRTLHNPAKAFEYAIGAMQAAKEPNPNVLDTMAEAYYAQDDYDHAIQTEEKALALKPDEPAFKERLVKYQQAKTEHQQQ
jgi:TPR repeat protein